MKKRTPRIQYGKSYRYRSTEEALRDLKRLEKKQREEKEKENDSQKSRHTRR